ncbi:MAG: hypothetical protein P4L82_01580 [Ancalomicrobiaceae bacterium]|nr:hypothetical protein [Ancalomicrobiaceae bacterium]
MARRIPDPAPVGHRLVGAEVMEFARRNLVHRLAAKRRLGLGEFLPCTVMFDVGQPGGLGVRHGPKRLDDLAFADRCFELRGNTNAELPDASASRKTGYFGHLLIAVWCSVV